MVVFRKLLTAGLASLVFGGTSCRDKVDVPKSVYPAEDYVLEKSAENQVIMFGEIHEFYRKDSDFVISILPELRNQGFEYFAIEIPTDASNPHHVKALISYASGRLAREDMDPVDRDMLEDRIAGWLDLIDAARNAGMVIVPYDMVRIGEPRDIMNLREFVSFGNIVERVFKKDIGAKVIVYCGAMHVNEGPFVFAGEDVKWLGQYINEYTGGRNFTVSFAGNVGINLLHVDLDVVFKD